ncbi:DUF4870 domain-containing protein [Haloterrigena alkaliphila]|uniref:DUF4870 domain-containing protein n=1 Tax=Haloterrigena alkaliphila TaxID=2816475 RepID=A0A8A2VHF5_9EURY|nr:hypothetical protein [Haloterrigena alkaliphila]QSX00098.1 hypothetical protein J0X25_03785 [Haloterrigena alkaliphila]
MASNTQDIDIEAERTAEPAETESGLDANVAGALSYLFGFVSGLILFLIEGDDRFVRFHAVQSMVVSGLVLLAYLAVSIVGTILTTVMFASTSTFVVGSIISLLLGVVWLGLVLGGFAIWVYLVVTAYRGKTTRLPVAAGIADKLV